jgi:hypothetical protein
MLWASYWKTATGQQASQNCREIANAPEPAVTVCEFPNNTGGAGIKQFLFHCARKSQEGTARRNARP